MVAHPQGSLVFLREFSAFAGVSGSPRGLTGMSGTHGGQLLFGLHVIHYSGVLGLSTRFSFNNLDGDLGVSLPLKGAVFGA